MSAQEITLKFRGDESQIKASLAGLRSAYSSTLSDITRQTKAEAQAAAALQRQRSSALITIWKADTRAAANEEKRRTADAAREERERVQAALSLQRQRSAALIAAWKEEQREQVRIAREGAKEAATAQAQAATRRGAFVSGAVGGLSALVGVSVVSEIRQAGAAWLDYSNKLETTRIAFTTMLGSAQLAEDHLKELQQFALKTPFEFGDLIDASQRMQALGFNAQQVIPILNDVGNAVAAAGGGSERLDRVVLAISQIQSKGKVATQELNQLAESGISGWKILEQQLGKSRGELAKMVEQGQISSKVFLDAFQKFSQQNFGGLMEAQSRTFSGAMSNIKDALLQTSATAFEPLFKKLSETALHFSEASTKSDEFKKNLQVVGGVAATIWDGAVEAIQVLRDVYRIAVAEISALVRAMTEGFFALVHAIAAAMFQVVALARVLRRDFKGATQASIEAQRENKLAAESFMNAMSAQGKVIKEVVAVYREAEERARKLKEAQSALGDNIGADVSGGAGVFRKKTTTEPSNSATDTNKTKGSDPAAAAKRIAEIQLRTILDGIQLEEEGIERSLKRREIEYAQYVAEIESLEIKRHAQVIFGLIAEQRAANDLKDANAKRVAMAEIDAKLTQENNKHKSEQLKLTDKTFDREKQIAESLQGFRDKQIEQLRQLIQGSKTALDETDDFITAYEKMGGVLDENQKKWLRFDALLIEARKHLQELSDAIVEATKEGLGPPTPVFPELTPEQRAAGAGASADTVAGVPPAPVVDRTRSAIDQLFESINKTLTGNTQTAALAGLEAMTDAFEGLGNAVGRVVESFILYGSAGTSVRKVTAEIIAGVARQAAVKAVFELAEGFAALAMAFFGIPNAGPSASAHFAAAAIYASIAGVAAVAGRGVAGNAFQQTTGTSTGSGSGGSRSSTTSTGQPKTVELDRATQNQQAIVLNVNVRQEPGAIVQVALDDHRNNGPIRQMILSELK